MFDLRMLPERPLVKFNRQLPIFNWHYPFHDEEHRLADPYAPLRKGEQGAARRRAVYIHIPFCDTICNFCLFQKTKQQSVADVGDYLKALVAEFELKGRFLGAYQVDAIFVGGGTPSVLDPEHIEFLGLAIRENFDLRNLKEFTFEVEVKSATPEKLAALKNIGVNRVSFGAQTFSPKYRTLFSLDARLDQIQEAARLITSMFAYTNVDILYGIAGQNEDELHQDAEAALDLQTTTIDFYPINNLAAPRLMHRALNRSGLTYLPASIRFQYRRKLDKLLRSRGYAPINGYGYGLAEGPSRGGVVQHAPKFLYHDLVYGYHDDEIVGYGCSAISQIMNFNLVNDADRAGYARRLLREKTLPHQAYGPVPAPERGIVLFPFRGFADKSRIPWERLSDDTWIALQEAIDAGLVLERTDRYELSAVGWLFYVNLMYYLMPESGKKWVSNLIENRLADGRACGDTDLSRLANECEDDSAGAWLPGADQLAAAQA
jgi:oxygen-independent coproporphyrinogen-3 oxidase